MYEARKICNFLITRANPEALRLTNLRLNKLLFFIQGHALVSRSSGLVRNHFEAWQYGPVVRTVYDAFKSFGERTITEPARYLDYATGREATIPFDDIKSDDAEFIRRICESYAQFSTARLVAVSHHAGGAWETVFSACEKDKRLSPRISDELIRREFSNEIVGKILH